MTTKILSGREFETRERRRDVCVRERGGGARCCSPDNRRSERYVRTADKPASTSRAAAAADASSEPVVCRVVGIAEDAKFGSLRERAAADDLFPADARSARRQSGLPAERADQGGGHRGVSRGAARDRADRCRWSVRDAARADGGGARQPACHHLPEHVLRRRRAAAERARPLRHAVVERLAAHRRNRHALGARRVARQHPAHDPVRGAPPRR